MVDRLKRISKAGVTGVELKELLAQSDTQLPLALVQLVRNRPEEELEEWGRGRQLLIRSGLESTEGE